MRSIAVTPLGELNMTPLIHNHPRPQAPPCPPAIGASAGDVDSPHNLVLQGDVTDGRSILSRGNITVGGSVTNAQVRAAGDLVIGGGAIGRDKCRCVAGGKLQIRHANGATLEAGGDLLIQTNATHARLITGGVLDVSHGSLSGGWATAGAAIQCAVLGSPSETPTLVEVGIDERLRHRANECLPQMEDQLAQVLRLQTAAAPLLRHQKNLTPQEKEKATELLYEIQEIQEAIEPVLAELRQLDQQARLRPPPRIVVSDVIHAGVTVRIGSLEAQIRCAMKGPLVLTRRRIAGVSSIVCIEPGAEAAYPLATASVQDPIPDRLNRILTVQNGEPA